MQRSNNLFSQRKLFLQWYELYKNMPTYSINFLANGENCEYSNYTFACKNVYLSYNVIRSEDIYYAKFLFKKNKQCNDSLNICENEIGYELVDSSENYNCKYLLRSSKCLVFFICLIAVIVVLVLCLQI